MWREKIAVQGLAPDPWYTEISEGILCIREISQYTSTKFHCNEPQLPQCQCHAKGGGKLAVEIENNQRAPDDVAGWEYGKREGFNENRQSQPSIIITLWIYETVKSKTFRGRDERSESFV